MKVSNFVFANLFGYLSMVLAQYQNVPIDTNSFDQNEVTIAISPLNPNHLIAVWNDYRSGYSEPGYAFSTNGGVDWNASLIPDHQGWPNGFDPSAAFDNSGKAFYAYVASNSQIHLGPTYVSRTTDTGSSWDIHALASGDSLNGDTLNNDKPFVAVDNSGGSWDGRIYVSWTHFSASGSSIRFSYSDNQGVSFSPQISLGSVSGNPGQGAYLNPFGTNENPASFLVTGSMPAVGPNGEVYVIWMVFENTGFDSSYFRIAKSVNGGETFTTLDTVAFFTWELGNWGKIEYRSIPSLTVDPSNGYVYVAYKDRESETIPTPRIKFVRSTNGGSDWDSLGIIGNLGEQGEVFPWVACDAYGKVAVTFMHRADNDSVDCYIVESYDHGVSFRTPVLVSEVSSNPEYGSSGHHYQGMALDDAGNDYVVWTDFRNGTALTPNADPYFARVNSPPEPPQNLIPSVVGENDNPRIDWDAYQETDLDYYEVWKDKEGSSWGLYATTSNNYYIDDEERDVQVRPCVNCTPIYYKLTAVDLSGNLSDFSNTVDFSDPEGEEFKLSDLEGDTVVLAKPDHFAIIQNYPNPFNPVTTIDYQLPQSSHVTLFIYNILGQPVRTLINRNIEEGYHSIEWDGREDAGAQLGSGVYIYHFSARDPSAGSGHSFLRVKKMILLK